MTATENACGSDHEASEPCVHCDAAAKLTAPKKRAPRGSKRTDVHRPGAIVPADYEILISYALPTAAGGFPCPSISVDCVRERGHWTDANGKVIGWNESTAGAKYIPGEHGTGDRCCVMRAMERFHFFERGRLGSCSVCGARFVYGDVWIHTPTNTAIHLGHNCADKYEMLADRSAFELSRDRRDAATATAVTRTKHREEREAFLAKHPELAELLTVNHPLIRELGQQFQEWRKLSEKQIALVHKLADEVRNPKPAEVNVPAPEGRITFEGVILSVKYQDTDFGSVPRITVKIATPEGVWLAWGTCPAELMDTAGVRGSVKGSTVKLCGTLKRGRDAHFAIMKRPMLIALVTEAPHRASPRYDDPNPAHLRTCQCGKPVSDAVAHTDADVWAKPEVLHVYTAPGRPRSLCGEQGPVTSAGASTCVVCLKLACGARVAFGFMTCDRWIGSVTNLTKEEMRASWGPMTETVRSTYRLTVIGDCKGSRR